MGKSECYDCYLHPVTLKLSFTCAVYMMTMGLVASESTSNDSTASTRGPRAILEFAVGFVGTAGGLPEQVVHAPDVDTLDVNIPAVQRVAIVQRFDHLFVKGADGRVVEGELAAALDCAVVPRLVAADGALLDYAPRDTNIAQVHRHLLTREAVSRNHVVNRRVLVRAKAHRLSPATAPLPFRPLLPSQMKILVSVRTAQKTTDRTYPSGLSIQILPSQTKI